MKEPTIEEQMQEIDRILQEIEVAWERLRPIWEEFIRLLQEASEQSPFN